MSGEAPFQQAARPAAVPLPAAVSTPSQDRNRDQSGERVSPRLQSQAYAALDLGTNNCRLLVARPSADGFRVIDSFSRIIRLGEGLGSTGRLSEPAIARAMAALRICRDKMNVRHASRVRLIATEACRSAGNARAFCDRVEQELGLKLEVIDRETEARLAVTGCLPLLDPKARGAILFDIGGGSTELVRIDSPAVAGDGPLIRAWTSLPAGVVTLAESFGGIDVTPQVYQSMVDETARHLAPFVRDHGDDLGSLHLLGTSGTVTTVAGIYLGLPRYDRRLVDGLWMDDTDVMRTVETLRAMNYQQRVANGCIGEERADLVLAGCAILDAIRAAFPCPRVCIADRGLREGMLVQMMREDGIAL